MRSPVRGVDQLYVFAHVTNQMGRIEQDFEKGEADGSVSSLAVILRAVSVLRASTTMGEPVHD